MAHLRIPPTFWIGLSAYVLGGVWLMQQGSFLPMPNRVVALLYKLGWLSFYGYMGYRLARTTLGKYQRGTMAAVLPDYLFLFPDEGDGLRISWKKISRAAANRGTKTVAIFLRDTRTIRNISGVFRTADECERFAGAINRRIQLAADAS